MGSMILARRNMPGPGRRRRRGHCDTTADTVRLQPRNSVFVQDKLWKIFIIGYYDKFYLGLTFFPVYLTIFIRCLSGVKTEIC